MLRHEHSTERAVLFLPLLVAFTVCVCLFYIIIKGASAVNKRWDFDAGGEDLWLTCVFAFAGGLASAALSLLLRPAVHRDIEQTSEDDEARHKADVAVAAGDDEPP